MQTLDHIGLQLHANGLADGASITLQRPIATYRDVDGSLKKVRM
jgi:hypothetical protein